MTQIIHERIAKTAKALAREAWELMAKENAFYNLNPNPRNYVRVNWKHYIPFARAALVEILNKDFSFQIALGSYTRESVDAMKEEIYQCLLIDSSYKTAHQQPTVLH